VKMQRRLEQCYAIKFCAKLGKSGSETLQLLRTAYGDAVLSSAQVFRWHKPFKDGRDSVEDEQCTGRPSASRTENNVARVKAVLDRDRCFNVRLIAEEVGLPKTDVHRIITEDLHMRKICVKLVPKNLTDVWEFLAENNITTLPRPPYSPDLAPCDFFVILKFKTNLKGHNFGTAENVQAAATQALKTSQVKTSSTATKNGRNVGITVFDHKEPILKGINCNCMYFQQKNFFLNHSHYFWDRPRT